MIIVPASGNTHDECLRERLSRHAFEADDVVNSVRLVKVFRWQEQSLRPRRAFVLSTVNNNDGHPGAANSKAAKLQSCMSCSDYGGTMTRCLLLHLRPSARADNVVMRT
jgi:hypothetical protein